MIVTPRIGLNVVDSDPLDDPGDFLGRGCAFSDCGVHVGIHFPTERLWIA
jgi:hypothetical protein